MRAEYWQSRLLWALSAALGMILTSAGPAQAQVFRWDRSGGSDCPSYPPYVPSQPSTSATPSVTSPSGDTTPEKDESPTAPPTSTGQPDQSTSPYDTTDLGGGALATIDSAVGYIDDAIPTNTFRLRVDDATGSNRSNRAEFFYAQYEPGGPGLPKPESTVNYQEISAYLETVVLPHFSVFFEAPFRFLNPTINSDHSGFGDVNTGFKWAFLAQQDMTTTFQMRVYAPTGDAAEGLGTRHVSVEPSFLFFDRLTDRLILESELRLWVPLGGSDYAGDVVRYGVGLSYGARSQDSWWLVPVVEVVGWTVLEGKESINFTIPTIEANARGDTIVNGKFGLRAGMGEQFDVYAGYGRALTGDVWYKDIWRAEVRIHY